MLRRSIVGLACAVVFAFAATAQAQENATLTLRSGERFTGQLVDLGGIGLTFRYGGTDRQFPPGDVAVIEFEGAPAHTLTADQLRELNNGQHVIVFRDGHVVVGHFADVGEQHPLRITLQTPSGTTNYHSNEIWRIYMAPPPASAQGTTTGTTTGSTTAQPSVPGAIVVSATQQWTPTGITVRRGERVTFNSTGEVQLSTDSNDKAQPAGAMSQRKAPGSPLPAELAGALIGRIGNGEPFAIGNQAAIPMPASGPLYLGINDDALGDNSGQFNVVITRPRR
ncbi:MAG: hypothetical protein ACM36C_01590 [Acidobacteriota bacterium]